MSDSPEIPNGFRARFSLKKLFSHINKGAAELQNRFTSYRADEDIKQIFENEVKRLAALPGVEQAITFEPGSLQFIHATHSKEIAESIAHKGIYCVRSGLSGVAVQLSDDPDKRINPIATRSGGNRYVVVINLPPLREDVQEYVTWANRELALGIKRDSLLAIKLPEDRKIDGKGYFRNYDYYLPGKFIKGFLDAYTGKFQRNSGFNPMIGQQDFENFIPKLQDLDLDTDPDAYHRFH